MIENENRPSVATGAANDETTATPNDTVTPFPRVFDTREMDPLEVAVSGGVLQASPEEALTALNKLRPGDIAEPRLTAVLRAAWLVLRAGERLSPTTMFDAAKQHGIVRPSQLNYFAIMCCDLMAPNAAPLGEAELLRLPLVIGNAIRREAAADEIRIRQAIDELGDDTELAQVLRSIAEHLNACADRLENEVIGK